LKSISEAAKFQEVSEDFSMVGVSFERVISPAFAPWEEKPRKFPGRLTHSLLDPSSLGHVQELPKNKKKRLSSLRIERKTY
jgi:hypothetical protein